MPNSRLYLVLHLIGWEDGTRVFWTNHTAKQSKTKATPNYFRHSTENCFKRTPKLLEASYSPFILGKSLFIFTSSMDNLKTIVFLFPNCSLSSLHTLLFFLWLIVKDFFVHQFWKKTEDTFVNMGKRVLHSTLRIISLKRHQIMM